MPANVLIREDVVSTLASPGNDVNIPTEKAVRSAITALTTNDITQVTDKKYVTDAEKVVIGNTSGTNSGNQTSIVGITGTKSQFDTAVTDGNFLYSGDVTSNATHTGDAEGATSLTVKKINGVALSGLATGILKNTNSTGVPSIAINSDLPQMSATVSGATPTPPNNTTTYLRGDGTFSDPYVARLVLSGDVSTAANTTPVSLSLSFNYEVNSKYVIEIYAIVAPAAATTGCGFLIDVSSAVTYVATSHFNQLAITGTVSSGGSIGDLGATSQGVSSGMVGTGSNMVSGQGMLITTTNTGTATINFRSETTAVTTCKAGSMFLVRKI
jgi:hypothetical protein